MGTAPPHLQLATWLRSTEMLKLVVAAAMLHVVASKPLDVNVEVTVNGVKIPIKLDKPEKSGYYAPHWFTKSAENSKTKRQGNTEGEEASKSGMYIGLYGK